MKKVIPVAALILLGVLCAPTVAQEWTTTRRVTGVVHDHLGQPFEGARVSLSLIEGTAPDPAPVFSDSRGQWSVANLRPGTWGLAIEAEGYLTSEGQVVVPSAGPVEPVRARLRSERVILPKEFPAEPPSGETRRKRTERPLLPPEPHRTGRYRTTFDKRVPASGIDYIIERFTLDRSEIEWRDPLMGGFDLADESFEVYAPETYRPDTPYGLFVWVSPGPFGGFEEDDVLSTFDDFRLVVVGANNSGNDRRMWDRIALGVEAAQHLKALYNIDPRRVYVGGYSGGGRISSGLVMHYSEIFRGAFFFFGVSHYLDMPVTYHPGSVWPSFFVKPPKSSLKRLKKESRLVLLTGELDFNRAQTISVYESLLDEGFNNVTYLELPGVGHYDGVEVEWLVKGFRALDGAAGSE